MADADRAGGPEGGLVANNYTFNVVDTNDLVSTTAEADITRCAQYVISLISRYLDWHGTMDFVVVIRPNSELTFSSADGLLPSITQVSWNGSQWVNDTLVECTTGFDRAPASPDAGCTIYLGKDGSIRNYGSPVWFDPAPAFGIDPGVPAGMHDFVGIFTHEIFHSLGFINWTQQWKSRLVSGGDRDYFVGPASSGLYGGSIPFAVASDHYGLTADAAVPISRGLMFQWGNYERNRWDIGRIDLAILADLGMAVKSYAGLPLFEMLDSELSLVGTAGNDTLYGDYHANSLTGGQGNDRLDGGGGADTMTGGLGDDTYVVDASSDAIVENSGEGTDTVETTLATYTLGANLENLTAISSGGNSQTSLRGNALDNVVVGGNGVDVIDLRDGGNDSASGGAGNDGFLFGAALSAGDATDGGAGTNDQVILQGDYSALRILPSGLLVNSEVLSLLSGTDTLFGGTGTASYSYNLKTVDNNVAADARLFVDFTNLVAGENVTFDGSAETNGAFTIGGGKGEDHLTGGSGADLFLFRDQGRYGPNDMVDGGAGNDELALRGNYSGASAIAFKATTMVNIEVISILSGNSNWWGPIIGDLGYDLTMHDNNVAAGKRLVVDAGQLSAGEVLKFNGAAELDGFFIVAGGAAADTITGGAGNDTLIGGLGADDLKGGLGNDSFRYRSVAESTVANSDEILDFRSGDRIDLTLVDANSAATNDQAFTFIGSGAFTNVAGQLRAVETSANQWTVSADVDGDGHADFQILVTVTDGHALVPADFLF
jgi:Ca2+-binding RTX toxin-like protein